VPKAGSGAVLLSVCQQEGNDKINAIHWEISANGRV
jgi:hypothetical protein